MSFLSHGRLSTSLQRYIQVDIDDIFVGQKGTRLTPSDVEVGLFISNHYQSVTNISTHLLFTTEFEIHSQLCKVNIYLNSFYLLIDRASSIPKIVFKPLFLALNLTWGTQASFLIMGLMKRIKETSIFCVSYFGLSKIIIVSFTIRKN
jgi:hypothetical protein